MTTILVIEDEDALREEIVTRLEFENFQVFDAPDGERGIQLALEGNPDLIICDVNMPGMSGFDVLTELRSLPQTSVIPFIFLTARVTIADQRIGMSLGADDYLTKPFKYNELMEAIRVRLERHKAAESQILTNLTRHLVKMQDDERRRIAQELSEGVYRPITSLRLLMSSARRLSPDSAEAVLEELNLTISDLLERIEILQTELWPTSIEYVGIIPVLLWNFSQLNARYGLHIDFHYDKLPDELPEPVKNNLYYVISAALTNVIEHSGTKGVSVRLWMAQDRVWCELVDGGVGFDFDEVMRAGTSFGLLIMRERVRACSGDFDVISAPGSGTTLTFSMPLTASKATKLSGSPRTVAEALRTTHNLPAASSPVRVLIAEEHELIRRGLRQIIERIPKVKVSAECAHHSQIFPLLKQYPIDVILLDLELPDYNTLDTLVSLRERGYTMPVIAMVPNTGSALAWEALQRGVSGCVFKASGGEELAEAIQAVLRGERFISPVLSAQALASYLETRQPEAAPVDELDTLTNRERQILELVANDYQNSQIADKLVISIRTVETHRANLMRKLGLHTKSELIRYAIRRGITSLDE